MNQTIRFCRYVVDKPGYGQKRRHRWRRTKPYKNKKPPAGRGSLKTCLNVCGEKTIYSIVMGVVFLEREFNYLLYGRLHVLIG